MAVLLDQRTGSHLYGLVNDQTVDLDRLVVTVESLEFYLGMWGNQEVKTRQEFTEDAGTGKTDTVTHEVTKFFGLLAKGNPSVYHTLFAFAPNMAGQPGADAWKLVQANRNVFFSQAPFHTFRGMAMNQLYDTKHSLEGEKTPRWKGAMHAVRLMRNLVEYCTNLHMNVDRTDWDRDYLLSVRRGEVGFNELEEQLMDLQNEAGRLLTQHNLPDTADLEAVSKLLVQVKMAMW